jgi:hypothetical protein
MCDLTTGAFGPADDAVTAPEDPAGAADADEGAVGAVITDADADVD